MAGGDLQTLELYLFAALFLIHHTPVFNPGALPCPVNF